MGLCSSLLGGALTQRRDAVPRTCWPLHLPSQGWSTAKIARPFKIKPLRMGREPKPREPLGPPFHIRCPLKKISGAVCTILPNENVGQSLNPQGLRMGLFLVSGSLKKSSCNEVIKVALSQCDWCPYKRETVGTGTHRGGPERIRGRGHPQA